jgi:hypothetical protein
VQRAGLELHVGPLQLAKLRRPQAMPEADQDHGGVPLPMAVALGSLDQLLDLAPRHKALREFIKAKRKAAKLTQAQLAEKVELYQSFVADFERRGNS